MVSLTATRIDERAFCCAARRRQGAVQPLPLRGGAGRLLAYPGWALRRHRHLILSVFVAMIGVTVALFIIVPKDLVPKPDIGPLYDWIQPIKVTRSNE